MKFNIKTILRIVFILSCVNVQATQDSIQQHAHLQAHLQAQQHAQQLAQAAQDANDKDLKNTLFIIGACHQVIITLAVQKSLEKLPYGFLGLGVTLFITRALGGNQIFGRSVTMPKAAGYYAAGAVTETLASIALPKAISFVMSKLF